MEAASMLAVFALAGVVLGLVLGWFAGQSRGRAQGKSEMAQELADKQQEVSVLTERIRGLERAAQSEREQRQRASETVDELRQKLDEASNNISRLEERASRVPVLQAELEAAQASLRTEQGSVLQLTEQSTRQRNLAETVAARRDELASEVEQLSRKLEQSQLSAQTALEAKAGLEQQVSQLSDLQTKASQLERSLQSAEQALADLRESTSRETTTLSTQLQSERATTSRLQSALDASENSLGDFKRQVDDLTLQLAELKISSEKDQEGLREQLNTFERGREALAAEFKTLANDILEEKSKKFAEQNQANLGALLDPLKTKLSEFQGKVEEVYRTEGQERHALAEQVKALHALNQTLSKDAQNLTSALKGQAKVQGNWGELILERVLESAGLEKGLAYKVQDSQTREDGTRAQPDVVLELPEDRRLVIDAKVSLTAYERYASASADEERAVALKSHVQSVRGHIEGLSQKAYQDLYKLQSLDFVVAFVPVEGAFMLAVTHDENLFMDAWKRNVLLVSPSTLLFVVRTVAHLWRQEAQNRNAQSIAEAGRKLYEKFVGFVTDLTEVGKKLEGAQKAYTEAHGKLVSGRGNAIRQAEQLRDLGVKPNKTLPQPLVQAALDADDVVIQSEVAPLVESTPTIGQLLGPTQAAG